MDDVIDNMSVRIEKAFWVDRLQLLGILSAIIAVIITIIVFAIWQRRKNARRGVLLVGLCDSGKTLIFSQLLHNRYVSTHTSIKENEANYIMSNYFLLVIDIPGHERLRAKYFEQYKTSARGIIFVVDSVTIQKEIRDVAELLYMVLTDTAVASNHSHVLIVCNKQDQTMAKGSSVVKSLLEKELNLLRVTKTKQLTSTEGLINNNKYLGIIGKDFEFADLPITVDFTESTAVKKDGDEPANLNGIRDWLDNIA